MEFPYFGHVNLKDLEDYYKTDIELEGKSLQLDLNFDNYSIEEKEITQTLVILEDLPAAVEKIKNYIREDFTSGNQVKEYLSFHLREINETDLGLLLKDTDKSGTNEERLLSALRLKRIGFYPEDESHYTIFDFVTNETISQYLLVVVTNKEGKLDHITMES